MSTEPRRGLFRNWPLKIAAVLLSLILYVAVAAQEQVTQEQPMQLQVRVPPGRTLLGAPESLTVVLRGKIAELLRARLFHQVLVLQVPETLSTATWTTALQPSSVEIPKGTDVQVAEIKPGTITVQLDSVAFKDVPVVARVSVRPDSGQSLDGGLQIMPSVVRIVGPRKLLAAIESVATIPTALDAVRGGFSRMVALDTAPLGIVRLAPREVRISGATLSVFERVFNLLPVESGAGPLTGYELRPPRANVVVRGAEALVVGLTKDSLKVIIHLGGPVSDSTTVRLMVLAPRGITARAIPESVLVVRKRGRG
jgi:YbbR domain-containing protein